jgi:hypothetical protein
MIGKLAERVEVRGIVECNALVKRQALPGLDLFRDQNCVFVE